MPRKHQTAANGSVVACREAHDQSDLTAAIDALTATLRDLDHTLINLPDRLGSALADAGLSINHDHTRGTTDGTLQD